MLDTRAPGTNVDVQLSSCAAPLNPTVSKLAFTPDISEVAQAPDSPTWLSKLYV